MERLRGQSNSKGFTMVELLLGVVIFVIAAVVLGNHITGNFNTTAVQRDKVFAFTKAQAILSEIHSMVDRGQIEAAIDLDVLDDGLLPRPVLSVMRDPQGLLVAPDHVLSGNIQREGEWVWSRRISVRPFAGLNNRNVRYVTVRILRRDTEGKEHELASLSSVVNSVGSGFPSTQVFDVYLLAIENIPGWWVFMEAIVPFVESAITDLENRNPGLSIRTHWITKSAYGRNPVYRPYINQTLDSNQTVPGVYYYPGLMPAGNASSFYYVPDMIKGRIDVEGFEQNGWDPNLNPYPYALADYYNHAMRYPRAQELAKLRHDLVVQRAEEIRRAQRIGVPGPEPLTDMSAEPPLQILLEEMNAKPEQYRNALVVNLHGELLPVPPLRNYSDPAKLPDHLPNVRVVTHPEELRTISPASAESGVRDVKLRVYAYTTNASAIPYDGVLSSSHPILLEVMDVDLTDGTYTGRPANGVRVESIAGGVWVNGDNTYHQQSAKNYNYDSYVWPEMIYSCFLMDRGYGQRKSTLFVLYNTPLTCPVVNNKGLAANTRSRPYGLEYVPGPVETLRDFSRSLIADGDGPKNTARWVITIPSRVWDDRRFITPDYYYYDPRTTANPDVMLTIRTRLYDPYNPLPWTETGHWPSGADGTVNEPENLSETYAWWSRTRDAVPFTERFQMNGDPRHNPYRDLLSGDPDFGDGYNWFFDGLTNNAQNALTDHPGIVRAFNQWNGGPRFDVPRAMELYRNALVKSESIYTTLSGYSYYYMGVGNEIGYDSANGYATSIPTNLQPWGGSPTSTGYIDNILGRRSLVRDHGSGNTYWWGMPWLGELYPDWAFSSQWMAVDLDGKIRGNLAAGTGATTCYRISEQAAYAASWRLAQGTAFTDSRQITSTPACVSFFNNGSTSAHFNHHFSDGTGNLVGAGVELGTNYGLAVPPATSINRPFSLNTSGNNPPEFGYAPYSNQRFVASILRTFYDHPSGYTGSGLVQLELPDRSKASWIVVNGLAETAQTGSAAIAKHSLLSMTQSFFELGDTTLRFRIAQPPRIEIVSPTEISELIQPTSIDVQFKTEWLRWDQLPYTTSTPATFAEDESLLDYVVLYSRDAGVSWQYAIDDSPAVIGERPADPRYLIADAGTGDEVFRWATPSAAFPEGSYLIRVEAYRRGAALHYSVHQNKIYIER